MLRARIHMNDCDKDYHVEIDEKIKHLSSLQEYKITGKTLVQQIKQRLNQIGIQLTNDKELENIDLDLENISKRDAQRKLRANYGNLSSEISQK